MAFKNLLKKKKEIKNKKKLSKKKRELSQTFKTYLYEYITITKSQEYEVISPLHVDELASKIASLYEKIRRIIDWKEEHLIRRFAIERVLKRIMIPQISGISILSALDPSKMAEPLVLELIRTGYFPNNKIPKEKVLYIEKVLEKYIYILEHSKPTQNHLSLNLKTKVQFYNWLLSIAACEIEEILDPSFFESSLINFMTYRIYERIKVIPESEINNIAKFYQTYIAVHRALYDLEPGIIIYHLIRCRYPMWTKNTKKILPEFTENIMQIWKGYESELNFKYSARFYRICEQYDTVYLVIGDIFKLFKGRSEILEDIFAHPAKLETYIKKVYDKRLSTLKRRLFRSAVYSTLSIFLAGGVSLFLFEVPIATLFYGHFSLTAIIIDILLPTVLMFLLVAMIRLPSKKNFDRVRDEVYKIVYQNGKIDVYEFDFVKKKNLFKNCIFGLIFLFFGLVSLGFIFWIFYIAKIPWTSVYIDTINIAVIVFAAIVIRERAKEMTVEESSNIFEFILDMISIPIAKVGQWFALKWHEYNFVSVFFSALVDTPFVKIINIFEDWRKYIKDKKSGIH